jgi:ADP-ribosylglycohydrolase
MGIPHDYEERVYAGVLGKIIGVYLGRPFEGWTHDRIIKELGEIKYYVHEKLNKPLIVTDDDIAGTFAFLRAMPDYGNSPDLTAAQIGRTWLNYLIEKKTVLWWGGMGNSTEHTAYLRLKAGIEAPESGSMALNGQVVAEQIGAQIFIDGWGMISPGDPERAAAFARRAASVSHDGEAIYGAQVIAAMEAQAFVESDVQALLDTGVAVIPSDSLIYRMIADLRDWHVKYDSWYDCFYRIAANYGYDKYGGNCHMVPNHALIIMALLYCEDSFARALTIVNTAGWDTDCNSGNVGCLMGIKNSLAGIDAGPDFRSAVADRMWISTADGGNTVTDALREAYSIIHIGRALADQNAAPPKGGARYHFSLPGSVQGFVEEASPEASGLVALENVKGYSEFGTRSLAIRYTGLADGRRARIQTETYPSIRPMGGYLIEACPTLYPGQLVRARLTADERNRRAVETRLYVKAYGADDALFAVCSPRTTMNPGASATLEWPVDLAMGCPIGWLGLEILSNKRADGVVYLDWLSWSDVPRLTLGAPDHNGTRWLRAWVNATDHEIYPDPAHTYRLIQDSGTGMIIQGARQWRDYALSATLTPHLARSFGIAVRVQGLGRYYALRVTGEGMLQLIRELDGTHILAETPIDFALYRSYELALSANGSRIVGSLGGEKCFDLVDESLLDGGAIGLLIEEGRVGCSQVSVEPIPDRS